MYSRYLSVRSDAKWNRWMRDYLSFLIEHHRYCSGRSDHEIIVEVVQIREDVNPRLKWELGVTVDAYRDSHGVVSSARLRTENRLTNTQVSELYPLEGMADDADLKENSVSSPSALQAKPERVAAISALDLMKIYNYYC